MDYFYLIDVILKGLMKNLRIVTSSSKSKGRTTNFSESENIAWILIKNYLIKN